MKFGDIFPYLLLVLVILLRGNDSDGLIPSSDSKKRGREGKNTEEEIDILTEAATPRSLSA